MSSGVTTTTTELPIIAALRQGQVYLPGGVAGADPWLGQFDQLPQAAAAGAGRKVPLLAFLPGSTDRGLEGIIIDELARPLDIAMVALNTHAVIGRPQYRTPAPPDRYAAAHALRHAEVDLLLGALPALAFAEDQPMILLGVSEGAVAAGCHASMRFGLRIVVAWAMEPGYFHPDPVPGGDETTVFLNVIGGDDRFFGAKSEYARPGTTGHSADRLADRAGSQVVILPGHGHRVLEESTHAFEEIRSFTRRWLDRSRRDNQQGNTTCV